MSIIEFLDQFIFNCPSVKPFCLIVLLDITKIGQDAFQLYWALQTFCFKLGLLKALYILERVVNNLQSK
jgi:hypothetical protein